MATDTQFTPGPWVWHQCFDPTGKRITSLDVCQPKAHSLTGIAVLASVWGNEANANLIAAAPDLYEAVRLFVEEYDANDDHAGVGMMLAYNNALTAAKAALAKVRAEQVSA